MSIHALTAWSFLRSEKQIGDLFANLGGLDLQDYEVWAKYAYFPLIQSIGGVAALSRLAGNGKGIISGVIDSNKLLLPKGLQTKTECLSLNNLITQFEIVISH